MNIQEVQHINGLSVFSSILIDKLSKGNEGEVITDEELGKLIDGKDTTPGGDGYGYLQTAVKKVITMGKVWQRVKGANAIKCINSSEKLEHSRVQLKGIGRKAKRSYNVIKTTDLLQLSVEQVRELNAITAQTYLLSQSAKTSITKALEIRNVTESQNKNILDLFKG